MHASTEVVQSLRRRWISRQRYRTYAAMPTWLLIVLGGGAAIALSSLTWMLGRAVPSYFEAATEAGGFGIEGTVLGAVLLVVGAWTWLWAEIAAACRAEPRKRYFA